MLKIQRKKTTRNRTNICKKKLIMKISETGKEKAALLYNTYMVKLSTVNNGTKEFTQQPFC